MYSVFFFVNKIIEYLNFKLFFDINQRLIIELLLNNKININLFNQILVAAIK